MSRIPGGRALLELAALIGVGLLAIVSVPPDARVTTTRVVILVTGTIAALRVLGRSSAVTASSPERFDLEAAETASRPPEISDLRSMETALRMATSSAFGLEFMLKPRLRELARWRLQRNHGIDMDATPEAAERVLGEPLWRLVRATGHVPEYRAPGATLGEVQAGIERLERI
jgi:hypothetical protein